MREMAGPEKMPWVRMAYTLTAPADINLNTHTHTESVTAAEALTPFHTKSAIQITRFMNIFFSFLLISSVADGAAGVCHIIHQYGHPVFDVSHQNHAVHLVGLLPFFVNEGKVNIEPVCNGGHPVNGETELRDQPRHTLNRQ